MAVYQALTPRLNPLKMDQNSKKRGEKDNLPENKGRYPVKKETAWIKNHETKKFFFR